MSQRNPMNERNTQEGSKKGVTRKSASAAKPKRAAAASVHVVEKTAAEKKAIAKAERKKANDRQREIDSKYYAPPTAEYKRMRIIWWGVIALAIVVTAAAFLLQNNLPEPVVLGMLIAGYFLIFVAIYIDFVKLRKIRRAYQEKMMNSKYDSRLKKAEKKAKKAAAQNPAPEKKQGFFSNPFKGLKKSKKEEAPAEEKAE